MGKERSSSKGGGKGAAKAGATAGKVGIGDHLRFRRVHRGLVIQTSQEFTMKATEMHRVQFPPSGERQPPVLPVLPVLPVHAHVA